jgi:hypothetical protein
VIAGVLTDERSASLPDLLAGQVFTHRVSGPELEHDILIMNSDLTLVDRLTEREDYQRLADGAPVVGVFLPFDADTLAARAIPPCGTPLTSRGPGDERSVLPSKGIAPSTPRPPRSGRPSVQLSSDD